MTRVNFILLSLVAIVVASFAYADEPLVHDGSVFTKLLATTDTADVLPAPPTESVPRAATPRFDSDSVAAERLPYDAAPVIVAGDTLFFVFQRLGVFTAKERANKTAERIELLISSPMYRDVPLTLVEDVGITAVMAGELTVVVVSNKDAQFHGGLRQEIAAARAQTVQHIVDRERARRNPRALLFAALFTASATVALVVFWRLITMFAYRMKDRLAGRHVLAFAGRSAGRPSPLDYRADRVILAIRSVRVLVQLALLYAYVTVVTGFFYVTQGLHVSLNRQLLAVADWAGPRFAAYLPELFIAATILTVSFVVLQVIRLLFVAVGRETIHWPGFRPEWAHPTYRLISVVVAMFALALLWPHLPGARSPALRFLAIVVGGVFVLGSVLLAANWFAGMMISYSLPFKPGDRVRVAGVTGEVIGWTLLLTRVRTDKNIEVTIPNAIILLSSIANYSRPGEQRNLILHTTVTLGYDIPWIRAHELLIEAALQTPNVLKDPMPFVTQKRLSLEAVEYELNAYTDQPAKTPRTQSDLHQHILDTFRLADISIHSTSPGRSSDVVNESGMVDPLPFRIFPPLMRMFRRERPVAPRDSGDLPD